MLGGWNSTTNLRACLINNLRVGLGPTTDVRYLDNQVGGKINVVSSQSEESKYREKGRERVKINKYYVFTQSFIGQVADDIIGKFFKFYVQSIHNLL